MLLGSGVKGRGGAIMIYRSADLHGGEHLQDMLQANPSVLLGNIAAALAMLPACTALQFAWLQVQWTAV